MFWGAIATNALGQIDQWNLVADGAFGQPYLTFITYNNRYLGSIDGLGSVQDGRKALWLNKLSTQAGSWNGFIPSTFPPALAAPEPSTWAMLLLGFAGLGYVGHRRARALEAA
jgi:hypothetical protein